MKKLIYNLVLCVLFTNQLYAQGVGIGTNTPAGKLDITATDDGVLIPRVALLARNIAAPLTNPTVSELVFNTATSGTIPNNVIPGFYYWNGVQWLRLKDGDTWREFELDVPSNDVNDRIYHRGQVVIGFNRDGAFDGINETDFDASSDVRLYLQGNLMLGDIPDTDPTGPSGIGNFGIKFNSWRSFWNGDKIGAKIMTEFQRSPSCPDTRVTDLVFSLDPGVRLCTQETDDPTEEVMRLTFDGNLGIATAAPTATLSVNGNANKPGTATWAIFSDRRLKKNISPYTEGLDFIKQINAVSFSYNDKMEKIWGTYKGTKNKVYQGVIAQDLQKIAPDMVRSVELRDETYLEVDPNKFIYALINAVKEQQEMIEKYQIKINNCEEELEAINVRLNKLEFVQP